MTAIRRPEKKAKKRRKGFVKPLAERAVALVEAKGVSLLEACRAVVDDEEARGNRVKVQSVRQHAMRLTKKSRALGSTRTFTETLEDWLVFPPMVISMPGKDPTASKSFPWERDEFIDLHDQHGKTRTVVLMRRALSLNKDDRDGRTIATWEWGLMDESDVGTPSPRSMVSSRRSREEALVLVRGWAERNGLVEVMHGKSKLAPPPSASSRDVPWELDCVSDLPRDGGARMELRVEVKYRVTEGETKTRKSKPTSRKAVRWRVVDHSLSSADAVALCGEHTTRAAAIAATRRWSGRSDWHCCEDCPHREVRGPRQAAHSRDE